MWRCCGRWSLSGVCLGQGRESCTRGPLGFDLCNHQAMVGDDPRESDVAVFDVVDVFRFSEDIVEHTGTPQLWEVARPGPQAGSRFAEVGAPEV